MTESQFIEEFANSLKKSSPSITVTVKSNLELQITNSAGKDSTAFLDNAYKTYLQDPKDVENVIQRYAASFLEQRSGDLKIDRARIVPIIKDSHWLTEVSKSLKDRGATKPLENVYENFNEQLVILYAEDSPKSIRYLTSKDLGEIGLSRAELRGIAVGNLKKIIPKVELHRGPLVSMITAGGDYEACLLLLDDIWEKGSIQVDGDIVVAVPARDILLVTGSKTPGGISRLRELATKAAQQSAYRLTDTLFIYRNGKFSKYEAK